ncbi:expressed unknown protein [Seminavis robusta]|uniref:Uncharacterized protein n=1 Tax=Seminavis robusta TaxID=568900 RepID=A0A9N8EVT7_9STRA|nr:expressed unknown protein [Seminavis robusta]|eukprot:Sro1970_g308520.1 n/a (224) ;mRNA; r:3054-3725
MIPSLRSSMSTRPNLRAQRYAVSFLEDAVGWLSQNNPKLNPLSRKPSERLSSWWAEERPRAHNGTMTEEPLGDQSKRRSSQNKKQIQNANETSQRHGSSTTAFSFAEHGKCGFSQTCQGITTGTAAPAITESDEASRGSKKKPSSSSRLASTGSLDLHSVPARKPTGPGVPWCFSESLLALFCNVNNNGRIDFVNWKLSGIAHSDGNLGRRNKTCNNCSSSQD